MQSSEGIALVDDETTDNANYMQYSVNACYLKWLATLNATSVFEEMIELANATAYVLDLP